VTLGRITRGCHREFSEQKTALKIQWEAAALETTELIVE
jgi:hypothetical protein